MFEEFENKPPTAPPPRLNPPPPPRIDPVTEIGNLSFEEIARSSEFKRFIYYLFEGKTHRGSTEDLDKKLQNHNKDLKIVQDLRKEKAYGDVMKEFKDKVAKIRNK